MSSPEERLDAFRVKHGIYTKGPLSLFLQCTRLVDGKEFPNQP